MRWLKNLLSPNTKSDNAIITHQTSKDNISALVRTQSWGLIRNEYFKAARQADKERNTTLALQYYSLVIYLDRNGATNIDMSDKKLRDIGYSRWDTEAGYFNKSVTLSFCQLLEQISLSPDEFRANFIGLCAQNVVPLSTAKPPRTPEQVWLDLRNILIEYNSDQRKSKRPTPNKRG